MIASYFVTVSCAEDQSTSTKNMRTNGESYVNSGNNTSQQNASRDQNTTEQAVKLEVPEEPITEIPKVEVEPIEVVIEEQEAELFNDTCRIIDSFSFPADFSSAISYLCNGSTAKASFRSVAAKPFQGEPEYALVPNSLTSDNNNSHLEMFVSMLVQKPIAQTYAQLMNLADLDTRMDGVTVTNTITRQLADGFTINRNISTRVLFITINDDMVLNFREIPSDNPKIKIVYSHLIEGETVNADNIGKNKQIYVIQELSDSTSLVSTVIQQSVAHQGIPSTAEQKFAVQADQLPRVYFGFLSQ